MDGHASWGIVKPAIKAISLSVSVPVSPSLSTRPNIAYRSGIMIESYLQQPQDVGHASFEALREQPRCTCMCDVTDVRRGIRQPPLTRQAGYHMRYGPTTYLPLGCVRPRRGGRGWPAPEGGLPRPPYARCRWRNTGASGSSCPGHSHVPPVRSRRSTYGCDRTGLYSVDPWHVRHPYAYETCMPYRRT